MDEKKSRVFVFGGARGIGNWFARKVLAKHLDYYEIHICDVATPRTVAPGSDFYWFTVSFEDGFIEEFPEDLGEDDLVILSVPVSKLDELLLHLRRHIKGSTQIVNFASVQHSTNVAIREGLPEECLVYGLHLLFGPGVSHPAGNNAVVTDLPSEDKSEEVSHFLKIVSESGLFLEYSSSEKHDEMMQVLQVGVHYTFFGFANYLLRHEIDFSELLKYRTLPAGFFLSFMARALSQPKLTYANIQRQDGAKETRIQILDGFSEVDGLIGSGASPTEVEEYLKKISGHFKNEDLQEGVSATRAAVQAYELASRHVHDAVESKKLVGLTLADDDDGVADVRIGYVLGEERGTIEFDDRLRELPKQIGGHSVALFRNDASVEYFKHRGINFSKKRYRLSKKRFRFLPEDYVNQWIRDNVARAELSFPVLFRRYDAEVVEKAEELMPLKIPFIEELKFGKFFVRDDRRVTAVCYLTFEATVSAESAKETVLDAIAGMAGENIPDPSVGG